MKKLLIKLCATTILGMFHIGAMQQLSSLYSCASRTLTPYLTPRMIKAAWVVGGIATAAAAYYGFKTVVKPTLQTITQNYCRDILKQPYHSCTYSIPIDTGISNQLRTMIQMKNPDFTTQIFEDPQQIAQHKHEKGFTLNLMPREALKKTVGWHRSQKEIPITIFGNERHSSTIHYEVQDGTLPNSLLIAPGKIQDTAWRKLFAQGKLPSDYQNLSEQLEHLITRQLISPESDLQFLRKVVYLISYPMKNFELETVSIYSRPHKFLKITNRIAPHYCLNIEDITGFMTVNELIGTRDVMYGTSTTSQQYIATRGIKKMWLHTIKHLEQLAPQLYAQLQNAIPSREDLYMIIATTVHEMSHIARKDLIALKRHVQNCDRHNLIPIQCALEQQADFITLLVLQNEKYFLHFIHYFAVLFLEDRAAPPYYHAYKYKDDNINASNYSKHFENLLEKWLTGKTQINLHGHTNRFQARDVALCLQKKKYSHPHVFMRIQSTLTAWAAYLVQEKNMQQNSAIDQIMKRTVELFDSFGITDELIRQILDNIVYDWEAIHRIN